jgi:hypothetical protein
VSRLATEVGLVVSKMLLKFLEMGLIGFESMEKEELQ